MPYTPKHVIDDIATIRAMQPNLHPTQPAKILDRIDDLCRLWIERSTFLTLATFGADGTVDVSPKGDPAGFVRVLDPHTLVHFDGHGARFMWQLGRADDLRSELFFDMDDVAAVLDVTHDRLLLSISWNTRTGSCCIASFSNGSNRGKFCLKLRKSSSCMSSHWRTKCRDKR